MRYLVAMTRELRDRPPPLVGGVDQAVHNYIVRMRPLRNAWLDTSDSLAASNTSGSQSVPFSTTF